MSDRVILTSTTQSFDLGAVGFDGAGGLAHLLGIPVIKSDLVRPGTALVIDTATMRFYAPDVTLHHTSGNDITDYIRDRANALRRRLGLTEVDYQAEDWARDTARRFRVNLAAQYDPYVPPMPSSLFIAGL